MTEKRFGYGAGVNWQEDVIIDYETEKSYNFYEVGKLLNELHEKKEILELQLKSATNEIDKLMSEIDMLTGTCHDCCKEIRKENKELKEQMNRLYNYFGDWHSDEMGGNQFSEMWDNVKESEKWD